MVKSQYWTPNSRPPKISLPRESEERKRTDRSRDTATDRSRDTATYRRRDAAIDRSRGKATDRSRDTATDRSRDTATDRSRDTTRDTSRHSATKRSKDIARQMRSGGGGGGRKIEKDRYSNKEYCIMKGGIAAERRTGTTKIINA